MKKSKLFTPAMDEVIKKQYPQIGGPETAKLLNHLFACDTPKTFTARNVWDRANSLGALGQRSIKDNPQNQPRALWKHHPDGFVGPCPHKIGVYLILGYQETRNEKGHRAHKYHTRCVVCGKQSMLLQPSIAKARRNNSAGCGKCAQLLRRKKSADQETAQRIAMEQSRREWLWVMQSMRPAPIDCIPEAQRFDGRWM